MKPKLAKTSYEITENWNKREKSNLIHTCPKCALWDENKTQKKFIENKIPETWNVFTINWVAESLEGISHNETSYIWNAWNWK